MIDDKFIDEMTSKACDIFFGGNKGVYSPMAFVAMREVMVPIAMRIDELEATLKSVESYCESYLANDCARGVRRIIKAKK